MEISENGISYITSDIFTVACINAIKEINQHQSTTDLVFGMELMVLPFSFEAKSAVNVNN